MNEWMNVYWCVSGLFSQTSTYYCSALMTEMFLHSLSTSLVRWKVSNVSLEKKWDIVLDCTCIGYEGWLIILWPEGFTNPAFTPVVVSLLCIRSTYWSLLKVVYSSQDGNQWASSSFWGRGSSRMKDQCWIRLLFSAFHLCFTREILGGWMFNCNLVGRGAHVSSMFTNCWSRSTRSCQNVPWPNSLFIGSKEFQPPAKFVYCRETFLVYT